MADTRTNRAEGEAKGTQTLSRQQQDTGRSAQRWGQSGSSYTANPFEMMDRMSDEMDRVFNRMFREFGMPRMSWPTNMSRSAGGQQSWSPRIEAFQKGDQFCVRAELPGLKKDDVQVELTDEALTLQGERKQEHEEEREGTYHSEREYGQFYRVIPLPDGVIGESAQANFHDGVLEITMKAAPEEANRGRRLEINEGARSTQKQGQTQSQK